MNENNFLIVSNFSKVYSETISSFDSHHDQKYKSSKNLYSSGLVVH